jgi:hypothetical protein
MSKDSTSYCARCAHCKTCTTPCYPVECLLESVTKQPSETPIEYADRLEISPNEVFIPPDSWTHKSLKRKVFELYFIDNHTQQYISVTVGCSQPRVSQIINDLLAVIDSL